MVLPFKSNAPVPPQPNGEPPRILTEEEQVLLAVDQGVHEVNYQSNFSVWEWLVNLAEKSTMFRIILSSSSFFVLRASIRDRFD